MIDRMTNATWIASIYALVCMLAVFKVDGGFVNITYIENAVEKGAVCLDGSAPAYFLASGFDSGMNNWLVHTEGGGWCNNVESCLARKNTNLGSSNHMEQQHFFSAILSDDQSSNPYFYNWNRVFVRYCDGSSSTGDVEEVDPATNLYFRGARVWRAIMDDLLAKGMSNAQNALLSGSSAGGLSTILHCDSFRSLLQEGAKVKCLSDAGFFVNVKDISGSEYIKDFFNGVVTTHGSAKNLPSSCTSKMEASMCFFPQYTAPLMGTPLFILNTAYDFWQIGNILVPETADPNGAWSDCKQDIQKCSESQLQTIQDFRNEFLSALATLRNSPSVGMFINSCYSHSQAEIPEAWFGANSTVIDNIPIAVAVGKWFYDQTSFQQIDCPYPCNPSCYRSTP